MEWRLERVRREGGGIAMGRGRGRKRGSSTGAEQLRSLFSLSFFFSFLFFSLKVLDLNIDLKGTKILLKNA